MIVIMSVIMMIMSVIELVITTVYILSYIARASTLIQFTPHTIYTQGDGLMVRADLLVLLLFIIIIHYYKRRATG